MWLPVQPFLNAYSWLCMGILSVLGRSHLQRSKNIFLETQHVSRFLNLGARVYLGGGAYPYHVLGGITWGGCLPSVGWDHLGGITWAGVLLGGGAGRGRLPCGVGSLGSKAHTPSEHPNPH